MVKKVNRKAVNIPPKISLKQMKDAIVRSGYLLEQRVLPIFDNYGYYTEPNSVFPDSETGKTREIDIAAIACTFLREGDYDFLFPRILCECKNNTQPVIFFKSESPMNWGFEHEVKCAGIPLQFPERDSEKSPIRSTISLIDMMNFDKFHHCRTTPFATQYCSFEQKKGKDKLWMAHHPQQLHEAFTKMAKAVEYEVKNYYDNWSPPGRDENENVNIEIYHPLVIFQGDLYQSCLRGKQLELLKTDHILFVQKRIARSKEDTYIIDVITEKYLPKYLDIVAKEMEGLKRRFARKKKAVKEAVRYLVSRAKNKKKAKSYRDILEF